MPHKGLSLTLAVPKEETSQARNPREAPVAFTQENQLPGQERPFLPLKRKGLETEFALLGLQDGQRAEQRTAVAVA